MTLTRAVLVQQIPYDHDLIVAQSTELVESIIATIKDTLASSEDVLISGFGKFCFKDKAERRGRNPATGGNHTLLARRVVTFRCSGKLRERINGT